MKRLLTQLFGSGSRQASRQRRFRPAVEPLESRIVMTLPVTTGIPAPALPSGPVARLSSARWAVLDFDGEDMTATQMTNGGWDGYPALTVPSFGSLFNASRPWLDMNSNGVVDDTDGNLAISQIVARVQTDYAPYNLHIRQGDHDDYEWMIPDPIDGDVIVIVTGGPAISGGDEWGRAPHTDNNLPFSPSTDRVNHWDEVVWAFGGASVNAFDSAELFINQIARTISHEMGHAFGLEHVPINPGDPDPVTHHLMGVPAIDDQETRDFDHDFNFQDIAYRNLDGVMENAHQHLTTEFGPSPNPWHAVLKPGTLTIMGSNGPDNISVLRDVTNVRVTGAGPGAPGVIGYNPLSGTVLGISTTGLNSLNPFTTPVGAIEIYGQGGNDTIRVYASVPTEVFAWGGLGHDTIFGGGGSDGLYGQDGNDYLYGGFGDDQLYGGNHQDYLYGEGGSDSLSGWSGNDYLYGGDGGDTLSGDGDNDYLNGGADWFLDYMHGGSGQDTFVLYRSSVFAVVLDAMQDKQSNDFVLEYWV